MFPAAPPDDVGLRRSFQGKSARCGAVAPKPTSSLGAHHGQGKPRKAFTLIEMLMAIAIIAILAGLLLTAIQGAMQTARINEVVAEIKTLEKASLDFKQKYGVDMPSSLVLHERWNASGSGNSWNDTDTTTTRSKSFIRRIWPNFDFTYSKEPTPGTADINGDGDTNDTLILEGMEVYVFLVGGVCATQDAAGNVIVASDGTTSSTGTPAKWSPLGFSNNPERPFMRGGTNRTPPLIELDTTRLVNVKDVSQGMPEYVDTLPGQQTPYAFASSAPGAGVPSAATKPFRTGDLDTGVGNPLPDVYRNSAGEPYKKQSFQIISPGFDNNFTGPGTAPSIGMVRWEKGTSLPDARAFERDNITNFAGGALDY